MIDIPCHPDFIWENVIASIMEKDLTTRQQQIIELIHDNQHITYDDLAVSLKVSRQTIFKEITILRQKNIIEHIGSRRRGDWIIINRHEIL